MHLSEEKTKALLEEAISAFPLYWEATVNFPDDYNGFWFGQVQALAGGRASTKLIRKLLTVRLARVA